MLRRHALLRRAHVPHQVQRAQLRRCLVTLAIETSCDDTCVAVLETSDESKVGKSTRPALLVHHHARFTSDNRQHRGVHPLTSLYSHQQNLGRLVQDAIANLPPAQHETSSSLQVARDGDHKLVRKPDFVSVTRGPGMRSNLFVGLDTAKGLAVAWQIPLLGVNHMQAHALTPRLVAAQGYNSISPAEPAFPFLSLLVSGGHTMLIHSKDLNNHPTLASTSDIAIGDAIDKIARDVLPADVLQTSKSTMYGPVLESFAFPPEDEPDYAYSPPATRAAEIERRITRWGWGLTPPMTASQSGGRSKTMEYSFSGLCTAAQRVVTRRDSEMPVEERRELAREAMRIAFEHLASRVVMALGTMESDRLGTLVVSGGVAANKFLKHILRAFLDARGYQDVRLVFPPLELCTDNAIMIGWTGLEMYKAGFRSDLGCQALRKWSLDPGAEDGGILGVGGWYKAQS